MAVTFYPSQSSSSSQSLAIAKDISYGKTLFRIEIICMNFNKEVKCEVNGRII
jgi:hypothetical protein